MRQMPWGNWYIDERQSRAVRNSGEAMTRCEKFLEMYNTIATK